MGDQVNGVDSGAGRTGGPGPQSATPISDGLAAQARTDAAQEAAREARYETWRREVGLSHWAKVYRIERLPSAYEIIVADFLRNTSQTRTSVVWAYRQPDGATILTTINEPHLGLLTDSYGKAHREDKRRYKEGKRILAAGVATKVYSLFENEPSRDGETGNLYRTESTLLLSDGRYWARDVDRPYDPAPTTDQFVQMCLRFLRPDKGY